MTDSDKGLSKDPSNSDTTATVDASVPRMNKELSQEPHEMGTTQVPNRNPDILAQLRGEEPAIEREAREARARLDKLKGTVSNAVPTTNVATEGTGEVKDPSQKVQ